MFTLVQATRFIAAALIVIEHTSLLFALPRYSDYRTVLYGFNWRLGVDFFFVLSGFIVFYAHERDIGHPERLRNYLTRRIKRIYPTYAIAFSLILPPLYFSASSYHDQIRDWHYLATSFLLLPNSDPFIQVAWTLQHEVAFYLVFATLIVNCTMGMVMLGAWFLASSVISGGMIPTSDVLTDPRHIEFLAGIVAAMFVRNRAIPSPHAVLTLGLVGFVASMTYFKVYAADTALANAPNLTITVALSSAMILCGLVELERSSAWRAPFWLRYLGDASYAIYLVHLSAETIFVRALKVLHLDRHTPMPVLFIATLGVGVLAGAVFYRVVEVPVQSAIRRRPLSDRATRVVARGEKQDE